MVQKVNTRFKLASGDIYDTPEGWCVNAKKLSGWLDAKLRPDLSNALLFIESETKLPFQRAIERKKPRRQNPSAQRHLIFPACRNPLRHINSGERHPVDAVVSAGGPEGQA